MFECDFTMDHAVRLMYHDIYEVDIVNVMRKFLKNGDTFIDVGSNIGYLSAVGLGIVGREGHVHSFEPVPQYFRRLQKVNTLNPEYHIVPNACALGEKEATASINITNLSNIGWNTLVPGMMNQETIKQTIDVPVLRLDDYIADKNVDNIGMIKIDTEGYEFPVLKGCSRYFVTPSHRPAILVEIAPSAYRLLGVTLDELQTFMAGYHYTAFHVHQLRQPIDISTLTSTTNVLFLPSSISSG